MDVLDRHAVKLERPVEFSVVAALLAITALGVVLFWSLSPLDAGTPGASSALYQVWKRSFPLAEAWMALTAIVAAIGLLWMKDWGLLFGCLAGSALVFLGLSDMMFFLQNDLYTHLLGKTIVGAAVHGWCLIFGPFVIAYLWGKRRWLLFASE